MKGQFATILLLNFFFLQAEAQFNETIRTGRPGQAIGAFTTGQKIFQVQSGVNYFNSNNSQLDFKGDGVSNNTVVRYGLTEILEISGQFNYTSESMTDNNVTTHKQGMDALDVGMRVHLLTGKGLIPNIGFQFRVRLPVLSKDYEIKDVAPRFLLVTSQKLTDKFSLITNWGAAWNGNDSSPTGTYVINLSFPFTQSLGTFVENYGTITNGIFNTKFDTGLAWLINNDLQLDVYGGYSVNQGLSEYFISTGVSVRTNREK